MSDTDAAAARMCQAQPMSTRSVRILIAALGTAAVTAYAVVMVLQIVVWNPLAAAPGLTLGEIRDVARSQGETVFTATPWVCAAIGLGLAAATLLWALLTRATSIAAIVVAFLAIIVGGAPAYFVASFGPGMALADAFGISGGDHAPAGSVLMVTSSAAAIVLIVWGVAQATSARAAAPVAHA